jgi:hypothetical protein
MIEFDKNQSFAMKDICLELSTSIKEIEKLIGKSYDSDAKGQIKEIVKRLEDSVVKLEKL